MGAAEILPLVIAILRYAPEIRKGATEVLASARAIWETVTDESPPTAEQQAAYDAALDAAHKALQES